MVNDFSIAVATVNGTGSQTANLALLRAIFKMGVPVSGKNVFPSNIQGLPTWFYVRLSHEGFEARKAMSEVLVAFNRVTADADMAALPAGGVCLYNDDWRGLALRDDVINYAVPVSQFLREAGIEGKIKDYVANMVYLGALAQLLDIPPAQIEEALSFHFGGRQKLIDQNAEVMRLAYEWTAANIEKRDPYRVAPLDRTAGKILITGNEAAALGAVFGGVGLASWYPITPSTSLIDALNDFLPRFRRDPETGENNYVVIQAEDELAAAGMVMGAGWAGVRAMTATSGPGISLMSEFVSLGYFAEIPSVIWDVQRVGPSTGLPTRTSQGDILFAYNLGHGDTCNVLLLPATVAECFEFGNTAFDLAEELQTPVLVMSDLDLGMNTWMSDQFNYPAEPLKRGKVLTAEQVAERGFARYLDIDGDGIPYRTIPGNENPDASYFNRGTGHSAYAVYSEKPQDWVDNMARLKRKYDTARQMVPEPVVDIRETAEIGLIFYGSTLPAVMEARASLAEAGVELSLLRLRALPINDAVREFVAAHQQCYVVELNRDGQMHQILSLEMPALATRLVSLSHMDGMPLTAEWLVEKVKAVSSQLSAAS
ncbi:MAG: 2-oxoacid:acceptor oxidoreductase subunit alpha [Chloroflexota bacterium]|jgi:2-oxoglutarate ferredoxin oxidoreductase subunit alpha